ncbi:nickel/cobalt transporter [Pelagibius sp. Alg239-R121]|uniref:nickel/cobalt transporter n=1 Tax=Pelagibius sp. Alg239-R121 TaxID=2993448 RepID=UPI0024A79C6F|nr:nickel/cobalt transporter [Pelagibius sp. Alg239-R121]
MTISQPLAAQTLESSEKESATKPALPGLVPQRTAQEAPGALEGLILQVRRKQQELQRDLTKLIRELKSDGGGRAFWLLLFASFTYGVFHAAGPGHGKMVISSYLLASEDRLKRGIKLTFASSTAQAISAILLVGLLAIVFDLSRLEVTNQTQTLELISYGLVIAIGLWMLNGAIRGKGCGHDHGVNNHGDHGHGEHSHGAAGLGVDGLGADGHHEHSAACRHSDTPRPKTDSTGLRQYLGIILAVGIRPCSGAVIVLLFTLAQGLLLSGIAATFAMALGTAITVSALAILSVGSRKIALSLASSGSRWQRPVQIGLSVLGSLLVIGTGAILLLATLDQTTLL